MSSSHFPMLIFLIFLLMFKATFGTTFTLINRCDDTVWPGILSNAGSSGLGSTGFELPPRSTRSFQAPSGWSGRFWARTGCSFDATTGLGTCTTGDCNSNQIQCNGAGATPPATLAEFTIGSAGVSQDFYDVSLVDGYNLPMMVEPVGGSGACGSTGCPTDLNRMCPNELRAASGQGCKSACEAFGNPEYCCSGDHGSPDTCRPSVYSEMFKNACPKSYSYAYDDATSTYTCSEADYRITFCPASTSQKSSTDSSSSFSSPTTIGTPGSPPPPTTTDGSYSEPQTEPGSSWLSNFVIGGSSKYSPIFHYNIIICVATIVFISISFLQI